MCFILGNSWWGHSDVKVSAWDSWSQGCRFKPRPGQHWLTLWLPIATNSNMAEHWSLCNIHRHEYGVDQWVFSGLRQCLRCVDICNEIIGNDEKHYKCVIFMLQNKIYKNQQMCHIYFYYVNQNFVKSDRADRQPGNKFLIIRSIYGSYVNVYLPHKVKTQYLQI